MKEHIISENSANQRLDKYLTKALPALPQSLLYKYLRLKRIKVNGKRADAPLKLKAGDVVTMYINDEFFEKDENTSYKHACDVLDIIYEDENVLLVNKPAGLVVHDDETGDPDTLINRIKAHLYNVGEWEPGASTFVPSLCNRIDRNTAGIVIAAKNAETLRILNEKIKAREINKYYLCLVFGTPKPEKGVLKNYLRRDEGEKRVFIESDRRGGALTAETEYAVLSSKKGISLVRCRLKTGRTHQIRAQFAAAGHPLVGDTKYGTAAQNRGLPFKHQALCSYKTVFSFRTDAGILSYLKDKAFEVKNVDFKEWFFSLP
ncbi:MAG: RluA family pseudouridine synthase [Clostridia bacterium]|nr:RluA family pseudouridine synthase [Clostridia bacterium]